MLGGLFRPVFVGSAQDGSRRLFIVEQDGVVRVLQPGASAATVFLDIRFKVASTEDQGLLGLAFHPHYASNGRFFVFYTRVPDGAIVVEEYRVSAAPNVADPSGDVVLSITQTRPKNHIGGTLAFGPDGYLYISIGDGALDNDPPNNAQNPDVLFGKMLRIDVDRPDAAAGLRYSAPADNPFVNAPGRDEIYALGLRNPWRFSFDRLTGNIWLGDVGLDRLEEVDAPLVKGGNYGWRVYEGTSCTNNDALLCAPGRYLGPLFEYGHSLGRCSITGGYVYRGTRGTFASGTYVYGDFCSGEIFTWNGSTQAVLVDTTMNVVSFGEDEVGELYVVDYKGSVSRISSGVVPATLAAVEYYYPVFDHYFVTAGPAEIAALDAGVFPGWVRTGESFNVYPVDTPGLANTCRFFSTSFAPKSSHFYTPIAEECGYVKQHPDWLFEDVVFAVALADDEGRCPSGMQPLYRLYNDGHGGAPNHRYTTNLLTRSRMLQQGWIPEGNGVGVISCVPG